MRHGRQKDDVSKMGSSMHASMRSLNNKAGSGYGIDIFSALKGGINVLAAKAMKK